MSYVVLFFSFIFFFSFFFSFLTFSYLPILTRFLPLLCVRLCVDILRQPLPAWLYLLLSLPVLLPFHLLLYILPPACPLPLSPPPPPSGDRNCTMLGEDGVEVPSIAQSLPNSECQRVESGCDIATPPSRTSDSSPFSCKRRRTRAGRSQAACPPSSRSLHSPLSLDSPSPLGSGGANVLSDPAPCGLDESWFITPPPCFTVEGAPAEASPMEDLLIEHPSMSVYVSSSNLEESTANMADSVR